MTERKFYKHTFTVTVLSEDELTGDSDLDTISYDITEGGSVGYHNLTSTEVLDGKDAAACLVKLGSDPSFFQLDDEGNDVD